MLMPVLSVSGIGVAVAVVAIIRGKPVAGALVCGLLGAWLGFLVGGLLGIMVDVVVAEGVFVALLGHIGAVGGAVAAVMRYTTTVTSRPSV